MYHIMEAAVLCLILAAGVHLLQGYLLFHPGRNLHRNPSALNWKYEDVVVDVNGGQTHGWYLPLEHARGTVLFSHGNAGNIADWLLAAEVPRSFGFSVLLYDYGGYGKSTGKVSEPRCYADAKAMWKWLTETKGIPPKNILLHGQSLGGGVTADLAKDVRPGAVVLESTFLSVPDVAAKIFPILPVRWLCKYGFDSTAKVAAIHAPILIIHSITDEIVPFEQGKGLFELANEPKSFLEICGGHNTGFIESKEIYLAGWKKFIDPLFPKE